MKRGPKMPGGEESRNLAVARDYLAAIERGDGPDVVGRFLHPDVVADTFPNRIAPAGMRSNRQQLLERVDVGRKVMQSQRYEITSALAAGDQVVLEIAWTGTLAAAFGDQLPAGASLRARLALFLEFRDLKIIAQRNYDCYEAW
jgi:ketosteroid isomerase-like protein